MPRSTMRSSTTARSSAVRPHRTVRSVHCGSHVQPAEEPRVQPHRLSRLRMPRSATVIPSAARLMTSLRDIGYDLPSAVADLVDNSIDAGAGTIRIDFCWKGERSFIRVADDGCGMSERVLDEAMRYGSRGTYAG